ncbi:hypothetical protein L0337_17960 [candidate division KSB1 bacterium]|nr:hypothetical protein [candidate division KSB1 bacterium]
MHDSFSQQAQLTQTLAGLDLTTSACYNITRTEKKSKCNFEGKAGQLELKFAHSGEAALAYLNGLDVSELKEIES